MMELYDGALSYDGTSSRIPWVPEPRNLDEKQEQIPLIFLSVAI